ncbi:hypothetical protein B296_00027694 [Ensete ventricosum]|uniref:EIPR1-like beta-propeller domain-containing protein n=1 Tax=Ensete ventricosum TaxID=4639 RepID=A0A426ZJR5_ENSVE|nr:hypothetical protein B296_00027694 [Ensete ventricosum]
MGVRKVPLLVGADATVVVHKEDGLVQKNASVEELRKPTGSNERAARPATCSWQREQRLQEGRYRRAGVEAVVCYRWGRRDLRSCECPGGWRQMTPEYLEFRSGVIDGQTTVKRSVVLHNQQLTAGFLYRRGQCGEQKSRLCLIQARCIADVKADTDHTSFLAGTLSLKEENEVHLIRLSTPGLELVCEGLFYHPNEIWDLKSCPFNPRIFSTVFTSGEQSILVVTGSGSRVCS